MAVESEILSQVLESHDRLIGVIDAGGSLVRGNQRARSLLLDGSVGAAAPLPRALTEAAEDTRQSGVLRRGVLAWTTGGELYLSGHFWPIGEDFVGFALRPEQVTGIDDVASALGIQPWRAQKAVRAAQLLTDREVATALGAGGGDVHACIRDLAETLAFPATARAVRASLAGPQPTMVRTEPPAVIESVEREAPSEAAVPPARTTRVLCVLGEDEETYGRLLSDALAGLGHEASRALAAEDARETLEITESYFDTVLVNLDIPAYAALDLAATIRRNHPATRLSFYTSGGSSEDTVERARRLGPVLPKGFRPEEVRRLVEHASATEPAPGRRPRFASGSRPAMRIRSILTALRRGRGADGDEQRS